MGTVQTEPEKGPIVKITIVHLGETGKTDQNLKKSRKYEGQIKWDMISEGLENQVEVFKDVRYWSKRSTRIIVLTSHYSFKRWALLPFLFFR